MESSITAEVFHNLLFNLNTYSSGIIPALMQSFGWFIRAFFVLYLVIVGLGVMYGKFQDAAREIIVSMILLVIIWAAMFEPYMSGPGNTFYFKWLIQPYVKLVMDLGGLFLSEAQGDWFSSGGLMGIFSSIDIMLGKLINAAVSMSPNVGWLSDKAIIFQSGLAILLLTVIYSAMYFAFLVLMAMGFFSIYILAVVGGPCIFFAAFKQTRFVFYAWVRAMLNYGLLVVFVSIIMAMCIFGMNTAITALAATGGVLGVFTLDFAATLCWGALTVGMLLKAPDFAAAISGGSAGSTTGIAGGITMVGAAMTAGGAALYQSNMTKAGGQFGKDAMSGMANKVSGGRVGRAFSDRMGVNR